MLLRLRGALLLPGVRGGAGAAGKVRGAAFAGTGTAPGLGVEFHLARRVITRAPRRGWAPVRSGEHLGVPFRQLVLKPAHSR